MPSHVFNQPTLVERLLDRAIRHPDLPAISYYSVDAPVDPITYGQLAARATELAFRIRQVADRRGGDRFAVVALPNETDYVVAFFACQLAGVTPATFMAPGLTTALALTSYVDRLAMIASDCDPAVIIAHTDLAERLAAHPTGRRVCQGREFVVPEQVGADRVSVGSTDGEWGPDDLALLQYTSGSTSDPKGVMISNANLSHNVQVIAAAYGSQQGQSITGWLPLYHDMGLIGLVCHGVWAGLSVHLLAPQVFIRRPALWLQTISATGSAYTVAPNFGYDLAVRKVRDQDLTGVDLSCLRTAMNGAEPVRIATVDAFSKRFGPYGFNSQAIMPVYGLAENTVAASLFDRQQDPIVLSVDPQRLNEGVAHPTRHRPAVDLVACGTGGTLGIVTRIVDPRTRRSCPDGSVGEIWISGPSKAQGYWGQPQVSDATFRAGIAGAGDDTEYLRTGDLGVVLNGALFITGRVKDVIIVRGMNYYPQDLEHAAEQSHEALRPGGGAAFGVSDEDQERVVLVHELDRFGPDVHHDEVISAIRRAVSEIHGLQVDSVYLTAKGQIAKTTSGKVRRQETRRRFLSNQLTTLAHWESHRPTGGQL